MVELNEKQLKQIADEAVKRVLKENSNETDILYRGSNKSGDSNEYVLWLSTSKQYAEQWGDCIYACELSVPNVLDKLADEQTAQEYVIDEDYDPEEEFMLYFADAINIKQMIQDGYTGYYFYDDEYHCLNVCLFKQSPKFKVLSCILY